MQKDTGRGELDLAEGLVPLGYYKHAQGSPCSGYLLLGNKLLPKLKNIKQ